MITHLRTALVTLLIALAISTTAQAQDTMSLPSFGVQDIGHGIKLHFVEQGRGVPVIFIHGSLSDYTYWQDQLGPFAKHFHAIAYSRRYNFPNANRAAPDYSAAVDADDLAAFVEKRHLGKVDIVGHSYGAFTALFFAVKYPQLVRAMALAEPPAVSLLGNITGTEGEAGTAALAELQNRMVLPMQGEFRHGNREAGVATFINYVFEDPNAWLKMPPSSRADTLRDAHEWDVMLSTGVLFPNLSPQAVRGITAPVLLLSGAKSYPFLRLIDGELSRLLPNSHRIIFPNDGHQMWYQSPNECRAAAEALFAQQ